MEKRLIAAIVLSFLVLFAWQALFVKSNKALPNPPAPVAAAPTASAPGAAAVQEQAKPAPAKAKPGPAGTAQTPAAKPIMASDTESVTVRTSLYTSQWTNEGGVLKSWKLARHKDSKNEDLELVPAGAVPGGYPFSVKLDDPALAGAINKEARFHMEMDPKPVDGVVDLRNGASGTLRFTYFDGTSAKVEKQFRFKDGVYSLEIAIRLWIDGREISPAFLWGPGLGNPTEAELKSRYTTTRGAALYRTGRVDRLSEKSYKPEQSVPTSASWAAYEDQYFAALFVMPNGIGQAAFLKDIAAETPGYFLSVQALPGPDPEGKILGFIGPKESDALIAFGHDAKSVINFSKFMGLSLKPIAELMLVGVKFFYKLIPNWGIAIILLTLVIKIIFFPLTYSSTKSMAKMADLQPKIKALRAKYKKAKTDIEQRKQMNEEMMRLYKENGVNPAGGCLPLLIQMPVFVAVYQMLVAAVEFRHSPFISFWINDLSIRDKTFVLPILMGGSQYISQKMTPTSADPSQAKMMMIMPVVMTAIFLWAQSGLVLYWLTSNVLQIGQQALINHLMHRHPTTGKARA